MKVSGWGRYPVSEAQLFQPENAAAVSELLDSSAAASGIIARGQGRSYGDSALAGRLLQTRSLDELTGFDSRTGVLRCDAGVRLDEILRLFVPRGWFLPVVPGTAAVSVGGAIASDVHGKNHHRDGCFSQFVRELTLITADGQALHCSPENNREVFQASCGGMGLTGTIVEAALELRRVPGPILTQRSHRAASLEESFVLLQEHEKAHYSVAWLDCMAPGRKLGRSLLFTGEHVEGEEDRPPKQGPGVPFSTPGWWLNRVSISLFNSLYYRLAHRRAEQRLHYRPFFFPLDAIPRWNRLYGPRGFLQYQFVLPPETALTGMREVLQTVRGAGKGSFLSVLKKLGPANGNPLSFPMEGYTLALDFKYQRDLFPLLKHLDRVVLHHGGRLYLAKDARMSRETFRLGYPGWERFVEIRQSLGAHRRFHSLQSQRLGL